MSFVYLKKSPRGYFWEPGDEIGGVEFHDPPPPFQISPLHDRIFKQNEREAAS